MRCVNLQGTSVFKVIPSWYHKYKNSYWFFQGIRKKNREWNFKEK